ncbi:MAG TPA: PilX N-terminal domain-containing pilus assembly protein [Steroidobacteraceae bacterium]|nr:PilX N-terminal domain-containing pilus assembly protein [Steroidobacteraceae bacterium]
MSAPTRRQPARRCERGIALVTSLLLLVIITILALSMFRGFGTQEKIAGNIREKDRALHAAETAQQYAEWWLLQGNNIAIGATACTPPAVSANTNPGQICNQTLQSALGLAAATPVISVPLPWSIGLTYTPPNMSTTPGVNGGPNGQDPPYFAPPGFYIADVGPANDGAGEAYQIDAYGYGGAATTISVVESTYEVQQGVTCLSCG